MPDYYSLLAQKIREAETDSGKLRELVYEAARLALRRHVNVHYPALSLQDGKRLLGDLEAAIERIEADAGGVAGSPAASREDKPRSIFAPTRNDPMPEAPSQEFDFLSARGGKSVAGDRPAAGITAPPAQAPDSGDRAASAIRGNEAPQPGSTPPADAQRAFTAGRGGDNTRGLASRIDDSFVERRASPPPAPSPALKPRLPQDGAELLDWPLAEPHNGLDSHDLVLFQDQPASANRGPSHLLRPNLFSSNRNESFWDRIKPRTVSSRKILIGVGIASHVAVAILAGAALYITMSGRAPPPPAAQDFAAAPPHRPVKPPNVIRSGTSPGPAAEPSTTASLAAATAASAAIVSLRDFPRPTAYGVYAISKNRLIELEQVAATPVDPRVRSNFQIVKPSRTVINDAKLSFIVYRRDLTASALDKVSVRIAAQIARAMTIDPLGKAVMEPPPVDTWLIRENGYDLRVLPVSEGSEMVLLRPEYDNFAFPPGRYELLLGAASYDFVVAGTVKNPAHCVEGVTTARGPVFYECRASQ